MFLEGSGKLAFHNFAGCVDELEGDGLLPTDIACLARQGPGNGSRTFAERPTNNTGEGGVILADNSNWPPRNENGYRRWRRGDRVIARRLDCWQKFPGNVLVIYDTRRS